MDYRVLWTERSASPIKNLDKPWVRLFLTFMRTHLSSKGQIVLPLQYREVDDLKAGQVFEIQRLR